VTVFTVRNNFSEDVVCFSRQDNFLKQFLRGGGVFMKQRTHRGNILMFRNQNLANLAESDIKIGESNSRILAAADKKSAKIIS
jgi:hypothetical protein